MPELPEVHTTVTGLQKILPGKKFVDVWADMWSTSHLAKNTIKDKSYFSYFKKYALGSTILRVRRRAKHILIDLENNFTILIHMKMTGHLMYGLYKQNKEYNGKEWAWLPLVANSTDGKRGTQKNTSPLLDPYNRHIRVVFTLSDKHHLVFCDSRKFGTIVVEKTDAIDKHRLKHLGPEPLEKTFTEEDFIARVLLSPARPIKTVLMDQTIISGIGNIYSDEMLHLAHILPTRVSKKIKQGEWPLLYKAMKKALSEGIDFGGDSTSDYRNISGERGKFHLKHNVYLRTGETCTTKGCVGTIQKKTIGGRSAHFCNKCQH